MTRRATKTLKPSAGQPRCFRVLGALGHGLLAPLVADEIVDGSVIGRVVLQRPAHREVQVALRSLGCVHHAPELTRIRTESGVWSISPFVQGVDLLTLRERFKNGVPDEYVVSILCQVVAALRRAESVGVAHGALGPSRVRLTSDGLVRVLDFRGGDGKGDQAALRDLALLLRSPERVEAGALGMLLAEESDDLASLARRLADCAGVSMRQLGEMVGEVETWNVHKLTGADLTAQQAHSLPPKVRVAAIGGLGLALGIGIGMVLAGWRFVGPPMVHVPGASEIVVDCEPFMFGGAHLALDARVSCRVRATVGDGRIIEGTLDGALSMRYLCEAHDGELKCTEI